MVAPAEDPPSPAKDSSCPYSSWPRTRRVPNPRGQGLVVSLILVHALDHDIYSETRCGGQLHLRLNQPAVPSPHQLATYILIILISCTLASTHFLRAILNLVLPYILHWSPVASRTCIHSWQRSRRSLQKRSRRRLRGAVSRSWSRLVLPDFQP